MNTTGLFTTAYMEIPCKIGETITLIPFGDVHKPSPLHSDHAWRDFREWAKAVPNAYFLGMGDMQDLASCSERDILGNNKLHESTRATLDQFYITKCDEFIEDIEFMRGRIIGLIEGNHYPELQSGITGTQYMCHKLGCQYLGCSTFIRLALQTNRNSPKTGVNYDIWAHHGKGAARLVGGSLNRVQQMAEGAEADLFLMAHDHKRSVAVINRLYLGKNLGRLKVFHRRVILGRTGSFLRGYVDGSVSYVADSAMSPTDLGVICITLSVNRVREGNLDHLQVDAGASLV